MPPLTFQQILSAGFWSLVATLFFLYMIGDGWPVWLILLPVILWIIFWYQVFVYLRFVRVGRDGLTEHKRRQIVKYIRDNDIE